MSVDNFISAVKAKRDEHIAAVTERITDQNGHYDYDDRVKDTDALIGAVLDVVEEQYNDFITAEVDGDEGDSTVIVSCASDLSTLYFEEVSN